MINGISGNNVNFTSLRLETDATKKRLLSTTQEGGKSAMAVLNGLSSLEKMCKGGDFTLYASEFGKNSDTYGLQLYDNNNKQNITFAVIENGKGDTKVAKHTEDAFLELASVAAFANPEGVESTLDTYM